MVIATNDYILQSVTRVPLYEYLPACTGPSKRPFAHGKSLYRMYLVKIGEYRSYEDHPKALKVNVLAYALSYDKAVRIGHEEAYDIDSLILTNVPHDPVEVDLVALIRASLCQCSSLSFLLDIVF